MLKRSKENLSLKNYSEFCEPFKICKIDLDIPKNDIKILRMCIRNNGGEYHIPDSLNWLNDYFHKVLDHHKNFFGVEYPFSYVTVRSGLTEFQTDSAWHVDGFSMREEHLPEKNYIWTSNEGTEYIEKNFYIPESFDPLLYNINNYLSQFVKDKDIKKLESGFIYCIDPYILHRRPPTTQNIRRTFVRISFVPIQINDVRNTQNPLLPVEYTKDGIDFRNKLLNY